MSNNSEEEKEQVVAATENSVAVIENSDIKDLITLRNPQSCADIGRECTALHHVFGVDIYRKGNLNLIESDILVYSTPSAIVFQNIQSGYKEYLLSIDDNGIGCVTVHPSKKFIAVGGKGFQPNLYIYSYPEKKVIKVLSGGAERGYACLNFNLTGDKLASVSTSPDFMLTIWDWEIEQMGLHAKAFGQDVINIKFSLDNPGRLTTSGTGHIRFWKMASTFTGLKLQGSIGKFGKIDLSDIDNFVEFPDGKILSGTEIGALLLWEGNFIKCRLTRSKGQLCHHGLVTYVGFDRDEKYVITAAEDGYIRWWNYNEIENAEVDTDITMDYDLIPVAEYCMGEGIGIRSLLDSGGSFDNRRVLVIHDTKGCMTSLSFTTRENSTNDKINLCQIIKNLDEDNITKLNNRTVLSDLITDVESTYLIEKVIFVSFFSQAITGMDTCHSDHLVASCSHDGTVRCIDYINRIELACRQFSVPATCLKWLPKTLDSSGKMFVVGFQDGIIRVLSLGKNSTPIIDDNKDNIDDDSGDVDNNDNEVKNDESEDILLQGYSKTTYSLIRKLVFKPHNAPVSEIAFSLDGSILSTAGLDGIIFFFSCSKIVPIPPLQSSSTAANEGGDVDGESVVTNPKNQWIPIRFVTIASNNDNNNSSSNNHTSSSTNLALLSSSKHPVSCKQISWHEDGQHLLITNTDGILREIDVKGLKNLIARSLLNPNEVPLSYEERFPIKEIITRVPIVTTTTLNTTVKGSGNNSTTVGNQSPTKSDNSNSNNNSSSGEGNSSSSSNAASSSDSSTKDAVPTTTTTIAPSVVPAKVNAASYVLHREHGSIVTGSSLNQKNYIFEGSIHNEMPNIELPVGLYSSDGKDQVKNPLVTSFRYSWSKSYLITGSSDGVVSIRPSKFIEVFGRYSAHNNIASGVIAAVTSFDDSFVLSVGADSTLVVRRVRLDLFQHNAISLFKDLDAGVHGSSLVKPIPTTIPPEPLYLSYISTYVPTTLHPRELALFNVVTTTSATTTTTTTTTSTEEVEHKAVIENVVVEPEQEDLPPGTYSIQDNAKKLEENAKLQAANELKARVRASIEALRTDYLNILRENNSLPEVARLNANELLVDNEYFKILEQEGKNMLEEVHKECRYDIEKSEVLIKKINNRLCNGLLMDEFSLSGFEATSKDKRSVRSIVKSFRLKSLDPKIEEVLIDVYQMLKLQELKEAQQRTNESVQLKATEALVHLQNPSDVVMGLNHEVIRPLVDNIDSLEINNANITTLTEMENESSAIARRLKRLQRKDQLKKHLLQKPNEDEDDIRDLNAITIAEKTLGDYKLKCADDYEVPVDQRINASKKLRQIAMLEETMFKMRSTFNERFLSLRTLKRELIYLIKRDNKRIKEIDGILGQAHLSLHLWEPSLKPDEFPDDDDEVTSSELKKYAIDREKNPDWEKVIPPKHSVITGVKLEATKNMRTGMTEIIKKTVIRDGKKDGSNNDNNLSDEKLVNYVPERTEGPKYYEVTTNILTAYMQNPESTEINRLQELEDTLPVFKNIKKALKKRMDIVTEQNKVDVNAEKMKLEFERHMIITRINDQVELFNESVSNLRVDRHKITIDLKLAELKLLTLLQEYDLLQTFENRDSTLQQKQIRCKNEETEIITLYNENKTKLEHKEEELKNWSEKLIQITSEFRSVLPETHSYYDNLLKIFKKKIKRNRGRDDGDDEDYNDDDDDGDDDADDDDEDEVEDICPPGCDLSLFDRILDLREKKADTEEVTVEIQKVIDDLKKTIDRLKAREKQIKKDAQQTELEVQQFQLQKQAALNQISVVVPLQTSQLYMFETSGSLTGPDDAEKNKAQDEGNLELLQNIEVLKDHSRRTLVSNMDLKSHTLINKTDLLKLQSRISELHSEIDTAKEDFRLLHKERTLLTKERENQEKDIEIWSARCRELQMLKFGKLVDLDELEAKSDRTKEIEAESALTEDAEKFRSSSLTIIKSIKQMEEQLTHVTERNTKLLSEVAELTETQMNISRELNLPHEVTYTSKLDNFREAEEHKRIVAYIKFQSTEIEALKTEINMLKRKEAPPITLITTPPVNTSVIQPKSGLTLPPISAKKL